MNKNLLFALLGLVVAGLGALAWFTSTARPGAAGESGVADAAAAAPRARAELDAPRPAGAQPTDVAPLEVEHDAQRTAAAAAPSERSLEVDLRWPQGTPADERASVVLEFERSGEGRDELRAELDANGRASLALPRGVERATLNLSARYSYLERAVELAAPFERVTLEPKLGGCLSATLVLPSPLPADVDWNALAPFKATAQGFGARSGGMDSHSASATLVERTQFELGGLRPGLSYFLSVDTQVLQNVRDFELRVAAGERAQRDYVVKLGARVRGIVLGPDGQPLAQATARSEARGGFGGGGWDSRSAQSAADGSFDLRGVSPGKLRVTASREGFVEASSTELEVADGETAQVELRLGAGVSIQGLVSTPDGAPAAGAEVVCIEVNPSNRSSRKSMKSDSAGRFAFTGLTGTRFDVRATRRASGADAARPELPADAEWSAAQRDVEPGAQLALVLAPPQPVRGRVVDTEQAPIQRFQLSARWVAGRPSDAEGRPFESPDGAFELWLGVGEHRLSVSADGFEPLDEAASRVEVPLAAPLELVLRRQAAVTGVVLSPQGAPLAGARVEARSGASSGRGFGGGPFGGGGGGPSARSDENGAFVLSKLSPGAVRLVARADGFAPSEPRTVELDSGGSARDVVLQLRVGGRIEGVVYDANGAPDAGRMIVVGSFGPGSGGDMAGQATSDAAGRFSIEHVTPGTHNLVATPRMNSLGRDANPASMMASLKMTSVEVFDGQTAQVVLGAPPAAPVKLSGRVTRGDEPVREGTLTAIADGGSMLESLKFAALGAQGDYALTLDKPGRYTLIVGRRMGDAGGVEFFVDIPEVAEHRLDLALPGGAIRGRVVGADGAPLRGVAVRHELEGVGGLTMFDMGRPNTTDEQGAFEILSLAPGVYTVRAGGAGFGASSAWGAAVRSGVTVGADGAAYVEFELQAPGTIAGVVRGADGAPLADASVFVRDAKGVLINPFSNTRTDGLGRFRYESATPGEYSVAARDASSATGTSRTVRVTSGAVSEVELSAAAATMLDVEIENEAGGAVRYEVRVLDEAGHDHATMMSMDSMQKLMSGGMSSTRRRVGPLPPGKYKVYVTPPGGKTEWKSVTLSGQSERTLKVRIDE